MNNTEQEEDIPELTTVFKVSDVLLDDIDDTQLTMMITNTILALESPQPPPLEFKVPVPMDEPCTSSQQNPTLLTPSFSEVDRLEECQRRSTMYPSPCVPAEVEIPALPETGQTPSCETPSCTVFEQVEAPAALDEPCPSSQQSLSSPPPSVVALVSPALWQPWNTHPSSCVPAEVETLESLELYETPSCDKLSHTLPLPVETPAPLDEPCTSSQQSLSVPPPSVGVLFSPAFRQLWNTSCEVSHSSNGQQSSVQAKGIARVTKSSKYDYNHIFVRETLRNQVMYNLAVFHFPGRERSQLERHLQKKVEVLSERQKRITKVTNETNWKIDMLPMQYLYIINLSVLSHLFISTLSFFR